jgi:glycogen debranching enzyme
LAKRLRKPEKPGLSLKGSGLVFVATKDGEIRGPSRRGAGLYAWDTRHLSRYEFRPRSGVLRLRSAEVLPDGARLSYTFGRHIRIERHIHVDSGVKDEWSLANTGPRAAAFDAELVADADFRDLFEVRRRVRTTRGRKHQPSSHGGKLRLAYTAVDGVEHTTEVLAPVKAWRVGGDAPRARVRIVIPSGERRSFEVAIGVSSSLAQAKLGARDWNAWDETSTHFASDSPELDGWLAQSSLDLFLLSDRTPEGYFPAAGIPWFVAPFGRDSILTALFALPLRRDLAPAVLRVLADNQGRSDNPQRDEEPGRIAHEIRQGEIVRTGGSFGTPYYGSVDATPLFVWLAAEAARWLPERDLIGEFEPSIRAALAWMDERGDLDADGFIEFERKTRTGILNQMWKDSGESLLDAKGHRPPGPIAAVEVQAYAYAAWRSLAEVVARRDGAWAAALNARADRMRPLFERAFWVAQRSFYAQALDGRKRQIRDVVSNPGHVLWTGIASQVHGRQTARRLRQPDLASGWGIRTRSSRSTHFDAGNYQNGAVWPHDTAIAAAGMARYGERAGAARTIAEILDTATAFPDRRLPELFNGEARRHGRPPKTYPVACSPQAWSAAAAFLCVRTMLGLEVAPDSASVTLDPILPDGVDRFEARGLRVGTGALDIQITRTRGRVGVSGVQASGISVAIH